MNFCCYGREMSTIFLLYLCALQKEVLEFCLCGNTFGEAVLTNLSSDAIMSNIFYLFPQTSYLVWHFRLIFVTGRKVVLGRKSYISVCI